MSSAPPGDSGPGTDAGTWPPAVRPDGDGHRRHGHQRDTGRDPRPRGRARAPRRERLFAAASDKGVPLRTILTVDAVVIATWVLYRLIGRLREVILWILIAAFIALVLNPAVNFLQRHRVRRGAAIGVVFAGAAIVFRRPARPVRLSAGQLADPRGQAAFPTMVNQVQKGHGWLAHTLQRFHLLSWVQKNAPKLETAAKNLASRP